MTDFLLLEKISELNSRTARPRLIHQKGIAAGGTFRPYMPLSDYTEAAFLQDPETETPVAVRFSRMMGEAGSSDSPRDTRGLAVRFATEEGNYDLICSNMPVYYINDPAKFPSMISKLAPGQQESGEETDFWGFFAENPEAVNLIMWLYSNRGTVKSYRYMEGYSVNTYKWVSGDGEEWYVRYRWNPLFEEDENEKRMGISAQEAEFLAGFSPDCCLRDLALAIQEGDFPVYELEIQMMNSAEAENCGFDFLSTTLIWPEDVYPYTKIGRMVLDRLLPKEDCERLCFTPSLLVPGIDFGNREFLEIMDYAHRDGGRQRGGIK
ncbi:catalase [Anaerovorax odorimutans]|uniref:catalase n=1 Tax=Anaerovorax odorimutans TaxID=109327 RepID=A0ABT1RLC0_9FIRM|nr:catalase [Anaerovorax odorimutans]MCQ4635955.1 catalase [Anaerovorax odorimutans]